MKVTSLRPAACGLLCLAILAVAGCTGRGEISTEPGVSPPVVKKGPPPHAPAHGYRAKHHYLYYPESRVYYDTGRGLYFYLEGGRWRVGVSLPDRIVLRGGGVSLTLDTDTPYRYNAEHMKKYPPGQLKKQNKKWK